MDAKDLLNWAMLAAIAAGGLYAITDSDNDNRTRIERSEAEARSA